MHSAFQRGRARLPGLVVAPAIPAAAFVTTPLADPVGASIVALASGLILSFRAAVRHALDLDLKTAAKVVPQIAIKPVGATLGLREVASTGSSLVPVLAGTVTAVTLVSAVTEHCLRTRPRCDD